MLTGQQLLPGRDTVENRRHQFGRTTRNTANLLRHVLQADSYSLGVVLWELVTGETPTRGSMRPVRVPEECPADVAALIAQCMAAAPADRPSAADIGQRLQLLAAGPRT